MKEKKKKKNKGLGGQKKGALRKDKLGVDVNPTIIYTKKEKTTRFIELLGINRQIQVRNT